MIDHVFIDLIDAIKQSLETSMLERWPAEEHMLLDLWLGDMHFESSYSLPGEASPANIRVDLNLEWPVWSQSIYRSWLLGESDSETLEVGIELAIRVAGLIEPAPADELMKVIDERSPSQLGLLLERSSVVTSQSKLGDDIRSEFELEISFDGTLILEESSLSDKEELTSVVRQLGPWLASMLVRVSDQPLRFFPKPSL